MNYFEQSYRIRIKVNKSKQTRQIYFYLLFGNLTQNGAVLAKTGFGIGLNRENLPT
jgi:hypothetical protein